jgi:hypothetical protein
VHREVKRLEIQIAESGQISGDSFIVNNSSSDTNFEDIEAYARSLEDYYNSLQFDDSESVISAKTV